MVEKDQTIAWLILPDGSAFRVGPSHGKRFELEEMQEFVEGWIERVLLSNGQNMYVNEEGKLQGMDYNHTASMLTNLKHVIVGPALLMDGKRAS